MRPSPLADKLQGGAKAQEGRSPRGETPGRPLGSSIGERGKVDGNREDQTLLSNFYFSSNRKPLNQERILPGWLKGSPQRHFQEHVPLKTEHQFVTLRTFVPLFTFYSTLEIQVW